MCDAGTQTGEAVCPPPPSDTDSDDEDPDCVDSDESDWAPEDQSSDEEDSDVSSCEGDVDRYVILMEVKV